jgi:hypothetical protein
MGNLDQARVYLSGAIDYAPDLGVGWRNEFIRLSKQSGLLLSIIDPCNKPAPFIHEINNEHLSVETFRKEKRWADLQAFVKGFRRQDLRFTDIADFLVIYVNKNVHMCGSYNELFVAEMQKKPIFCIVEGGLEKMPTWLFGVFRLENVFNSVEECVSHLSRLNKQSEPLDSAWVLIQKYL